LAHTLVHRKSRERKKTKQAVSRARCAAPSSPYELDDRLAPAAFRPIRLGGTGYAAGRPQRKNRVPRLPKGRGAQARGGQGKTCALGSGQRLASSAESRGSASAPGEDASLLGEERPFRSWVPKWGCASVMVRSYVERGSSLIMSRCCALRCPIGQYARTLWKPCRNLGVVVPSWRGRCAWCSRADRRTA